MNKKTKNKWINALLLIAGLALMGVIFRKTDWNKTWETMKGASPLWMGAAVLINLFAHYIRGARWNMLTKPAGYTLNARRSFYSVLTGYLVNVGTSRGGELARCALTARSEKAPVDLLVGTVLTERIIDLMVMALFSVLTYILQFEALNSFASTYIFQPISKMVPMPVLIGIVLLAIVSIFLLRKMNKKRSLAKLEKQAETKGATGILQRLGVGIQTVFKLEKPWFFIFQSIAIWTCYWLGAWFLLKALQVTFHFTPVMALSVMVFSAVGIAIPVPAGAGVWAAVAFGLESVYLLPNEDANTYAFFNFAFQNLFMIITGAIAFLLLWIETQRINGKSQSTSKE